MPYIFGTVFSYDRRMKKGLVVPNGSDAQLPFRYGDGKIVICDGGQVKWAPVPSDRELFHPKKGWRIVFSVGADDQVTQWAYQTAYDDAAYDCS